VDGTVTGDLIAFVRQITIRGTVKGNVISFARRVELEGTVEGSLIGFTASLHTRADVARNIYTFARTVDIAADARAGENVTIFASESNIEGAIGKDAYAGVGSINVRETARIGGNPVARANRSENIRIAPGARIGGNTDIRTPQPGPSRYATLSFYVWQIIWLTAALLTGLALFWIFPCLSQVSFSSSRELLLSAGAGFLSFVGLPLASLLAAITVVGLPLGLIGFACWIVASYTAKIVVAGFVGRSLVRDNSSSQPATALLLLAGLVPIFVAINLPYVGSLINFLLTLLGLGALAIGIYQWPRWRSATAA
jgi:hypothetical protein